MRTAVIVALAVLVASRGFAHEQVTNLKEKAYPYPVDKTISIDFHLKNHREPSVFEVFVMEKIGEERVQIPYFSLDRRYYLETGEKVEGTVYIKNDSPMPREFNVCTRTLDRAPNSIICTKTTVEER